MATIGASVKKTSRLMCVYEGVKTLGVGAEISAAIAESEIFDYLDAPILRLGGAESADSLQPDPREGGGPPGRRHCRDGGANCGRAASSMAVEVILPRVDMDMTVGKISQWFFDGGRAGRERPAAVRDRDGQGGDGDRSAGFRRFARRGGRTGDELPVGSVVGWIYGSRRTLRRGAGRDRRARHRRGPAAGGDVPLAASRASRPPSERLDRLARDADGAPIAAQAPASISGRWRAAARTGAFRRAMWPSRTSRARARRSCARSTASGSRAAPARRWCSFMVSAPI